MNYPISNCTDNDQKHGSQANRRHNEDTSCPISFVVAECNFADRPQLKSTTCPSSMTKIRSATCAISSSWVIITIVCPYFFALIFSSAITSSLVLESRFPVGSSANKISGLFTKALAIATRCCCPPERVFGRLRRGFFHPPEDGQAHSDRHS